jgi:prefoldin alpha subunit
MATKKSVKKIEGKSKNESKQLDEQNNYMQLQMIDQQARQLQQYLQTFDQQLLEIKRVITSLQELSKLKKGEMIFAPLASGIFVKAKLEDSKEVRVNVGNNTIVTKSIDDAVKMLDGQEAEVSHYKTEVLAKFEELMKQAEALQKE